MVCVNWKGIKIGSFGYNVFFCIEIKEVFYIFKRCCSIWGSKIRKDNDFIILYL